MPVAIDDLRTANCLVVANPAAAAVDSAVVAEVTARLASRTRSVRTRWTEAAGHAAELIGDHADADVVVAIGGDGTLLEIVQGLLGAALLAPGRSPIVCPIPAGSGNSTARNLYGDRDRDEILAALDEPDLVCVRELDLMRLAEPGVTAVLGASTGFLAHVLWGARRVPTQLTGIDRYYAAAGSVLQDMPAEATRVTVDGVVIADGPLASVAVGGGRFRARSFNFLPLSELSDGLLDVSTIDALDPAALASLIPLMPAGQHLDRPEVRYARGRQVVIERTDGRPLVAEFDGCAWESAGPRLTVDIVPNALRVLALRDAG